MAKGKHVRRRKRAGLIIILLLLIAAALLFADSNLRLTVSRYEEKFENLPESFDGLKIVQLSDLHNTEFGKDNSRLVKKVAREKPDIIAITGDMIDGKGQGEYVRTLIPQLVEIAPVYYVSGNHEWACGEAKTLFRDLSELGATALRNDYELITRDGESIVLVGAEDPLGPYDMMTRQELMEGVRTAEGDKFTVMLFHRNNKLNEFADLGVDLALCGHAHGGIVRLPFTDGLIGPSREWLPAYTAGEYRDGDTVMIVSRGIGYYAAPRLFNNPDIVSITLTAE